ncbi:NAD-dependent epimerase/dehydratase family protein, partial [Candidatus Kaiserbacteria bacterium]|nr:NAD-dependent epimerase/dehydratase family protein [Candidatus Kaiserbacteria bacterium]
MEIQKLAVVTGGAGFIGSHLCERLVKEGYQVISLDNYFTGSRDNHVAGVDYREGHTKDIEKLVPEKPEIAFHLGEYSRTAVAMDEPATVFDLNTAGTMAVAEWWRQRKCKLIYAGSSTKGAPDRSDGISGRDLSPYTWSKAVNTELVANYARWYDLPYAISYFYNVYGPRELAGR